MTPQDLDKLEVSLGIPLPGAYRQVLLSYPLSQPDGWLWGDARNIVEANQTLRRQGWFDDPWPLDCVAIGETGTGDYFFIVPSRDDPRVYVTQHDGGPVLAMANLHLMVCEEGLGAHVATIKASRETVSAAPAEAPSRKWWQFWK